MKRSYFLRFAKTDKIYKLILSDLIEDLHLNTIKFYIDKKFY